MSALISVIVLNWNGQDVLGECLQALCEQTYPDFEIIVVDNGSTDGSQVYVREHFPQVRLVELAENLGFCGGNNAGYRQARGDYIALLNNDTRVMPRWLEALYDALQRYPEAGSAASKMVFYDQPEFIDTTGDLFFTCGIGRKRGHRLRDEGIYQTEAFVFGACAGAALYRREMLDQIGFLDNDFFASNEDIDLSFRAQLAGWKCIYVPTAKVLHRISLTTSRMPKRWVYLSKRNMTWVLMKNMPTELLWKYGVFILAYHLASDIKWSMRGHLVSVVKGRVDALRAWRQVLDKRKAIQSIRRISTKELESIMCRGLPSRAGQSAQF